MNKLVKFNAPELTGIEKSKAQQIKATFEPMAEMLEKFESSYIKIIKEAKKETTPEVAIKAKRLRLDISKIRIDTEKLRKAQKDEYLRAGKAIDGVSNILKWAITDKEEKLKEIETYIERQEEARLRELQDSRVKLLSAYVEDAEDRKLFDMEPDVWDAYYNAKKKEHADKIEAEKKAKADRIAREKKEKAERLQMKKDNDRLKKEAEEKEKQRIKEQKKRDDQEAARLVIEAKKKIEREEKETKERNERARLRHIEEKKREAQEKKAREDRERAEKIEREKREKLEAELKAKKDAEERAAKVAKEVLEKALNRGDAEKVRDLVKELESLENRYTFTSSKNIKMFKDVMGLIFKVTNFIDKS